MLYIWVYVMSFQAWQTGHMKHGGFADLIVASFRCVCVGVLQVAPQQFGNEYFPPLNMAAQSASGYT